MVFKKIIFQNRYVALETPSRPLPPFMANAILNFHFDYLTTSLMHFGIFNPSSKNQNTEKIKKDKKFSSSTHGDLSMLDEKIRM